MIELTNDQQHVIDQLMLRLKNGSKDSKNFNPSFKYLTVGGLAGTGKTFLLSYLRKCIFESWQNKTIAFVSFTGKASSVLHKKLKENSSSFADDFCGTIHSLIYRPKMEYDKKLKKMIIIGWTKKDYIDHDLICIDEASMVNSQLWSDLLSFGVPIIAVGDHGQLPPIDSKYNFNLMESPMFLLTEIKRQALDNPIIQLTQDIKNNKEIPYGFYLNSPNVFKLPWNSQECQNIFNSINFLNNDLITLCGMNKTRVYLNNVIRNKLGYSRPEPYPGERIIFLKNNHDSKVFNGMLGTLLFLLHETKDVYNMTTTLDDYEDPYTCLSLNHCFGKEKYDDIYEILKDKKYKTLLKNTNVPVSMIDACDFGYCISVHKSQGSEFQKVICFVEKSAYWDHEFMTKWLYTACSRAKEKLFLITPA